MAKRNYQMTSTEYDNLNKKLMPYNIIIAVIAIVCTITLFFGDFWKVKVKYEIDKAVLSDAIGAVGSEGENDVFKNLDYSVIEGLSMELSLSIKSDVLLASVTSGDKEAAKKLIASVIKDLSSQVGSIMSSLLKASVKMFVSAALEEVKTQLKTELKENVIEDIDLSGMDDIIDSLFEGATEQELNDKIKALMSDIGTQAGLTQNELETFKKEADPMIEESVKGIMETLGDENGVISTENIVANLLGKALEIDYQNASSGDLTRKVSEFLVEKMDESTIRTIHVVILSLAILLIVTAVAWGLLFIFAVIRLFTKKKTVYLGNARFFGWIPYSLLVIAPALAFWLVPKFTGTGSLLAGFSIAFSSITLISFIGAVALMVLKWFGYRRLKKQIKYAIITDEGFSASDSGESW